MKRKSGLPKGVAMTNIGHPEAPKETSTGANSTHADEVAQVQEEALVAEENS